MINGDAKKYYYTIYNLTVASGLPLPELVALPGRLPGSTDIAIVKGTVPSRIAGEKEDSRGFQISARELLFYIDGVARYHVSNGSRITVEIAANANEEDVKVFLLGSAFGGLLLQRKLVALHGGTVMLGPKAITFTGDSGAGKSTLASALRVRGCRFLADDVSVIGKTAEGVTQVFPGYPQQKLCRDAAGKIGCKTEGLKVVDPYRDKFAVPVHEDFIKAPAPLGAVFELKVGNTDKVELEELKGIEKVITLLGNIYRMEFARYTGIKPAYFRECVEVARDVPFYRLTRPEGIYSVDEQISRITGLFDPLDPFKKVII